MSKFKKIIVLGLGNGIAKMVRKDDKNSEYIRFTATIPDSYENCTSYTVQQIFDLSIEDANKLLRYLEIGKAAYIGLTDDGLDSLIIDFRF